MKIIVYNLDKENREWLNMLLTCILNLNLSDYEFLIRFKFLYFTISIRRREEKLDRYYTDSIYWEKIELENYRENPYDLIEMKIKNCISGLEYFIEKEKNKEEITC